MLSHNFAEAPEFIRGSITVFSKVTTSLEEGHAGYEIDLTTHIQLFASAAKVMVTDRQHQFYSINTGETWFSLDLQEYDRQTATRIQSDTCIN